MLDRPRHHRLATAACLSLVLLASCSKSGDGAVESVETGFEPIRLALTGASDVEPTVVQRLEVGPAIAPWIVKDKGSEVVELSRPDGASHHALSFGRAADQEIVIPGEFDITRFNAVAVDVVTPRNFAFELSLRNAGQRQGVAAQGVRWERSALESRVVFDVRSLAFQTQTFEQLVLKKTGTSVEWTLVGIELLDVPPDQWLPSPKGSPDLVRIGAEGRRAYGLSSAAPLSATVRVPESGRLAFSYGVPEAIERYAKGARLLVEVSANEGQLDLALDQPIGDAWSHVDLPLAAWGGREATIRFRFEAEGKRVIACALGEPVVYRPNEKARTVLLVTSDTHRGDHVGAFGDRVAVQTPTLDRLAETGIYFADCFSTTNVTVPSHTALLTGTHPRDTGVLDNNMSLTDRAETLAERFREAGYMTLAATSVAHLSPEMTGLGQGFDRMSWPWPVKSQTVADEALSRIESWLPDAEGRSLFVWLHVFDAHRPYSPPEELIRLYYPADKDPFERKRRRQRIKFPVPPDPGFGGVTDIDWIRAHYLGEVSYVDRELARVLDDPRLGADIVAVTADHGESLGQHGIYWNHYGVYTDTLHIPLFLRYPGGPQGVRVERAVRQIDLGRTLLELAGLPFEDFPGRESLHSIALDEPAAAERFGGGPRYGLAGEGKSASINIGKWFLLLSLSSDKKNGNPDFGAFEEHQVELFDLEHDPACETDLVDVEFDRATRMRAQLIDWLGSAVETGWSAEGPDTAETRDLLTQLGYAGDSAHVSASSLIDPECPCEQCARFDPDR